MIDLNFEKNFENKKLDWFGSIFKSLEWFKVLE